MLQKIIEKYKNLKLEEKQRFVDTLKKSGEKYGVFPLSELQTNLLFNYLISPEDTIYNIRLLIEFSDSLDPAILKRALFNVVKANPSMRSRLLVLDDNYFQLVEQIEQNEERAFFEDRTVQYSFEEISDFDESKWLDSKDYAFDIQNESPFRAFLVHVKKSDCYKLLLTGHHIFFDGWSFEVIVNELKVYYEKISEGKTFEVSPKKTYSQLLMERPSNEESKKYWNQYLKDGLYRIDLKELSLKFGKIKIEENQNIKSTLSKKIAPLSLVNDFAKKSGITQYSLMLSAFLDTLHILSKSEVVSSSIAVLNRKTLEEMNSVGLYAALLPVISKNDNANLQQRLNEVSKAIQNAISYSDINQKEMISGLLKKDANEELFNNVFMFTENQREAVKIAGGKVSMQIKNVENSRDAQFDILAEVHPKESDYELTIEYRTGAISGTFVEAFENKFVEVVNQYFSGKILVQEENAFEVENPESKVYEKSSTEIQNKDFNSNSRCADLQIKNQESNTQDSNPKNYEEKLKKIWIELLEHEDFELSDNFFAVGGDSLLSIKLMKKINSEFSINIKISDLFRYNSICAMEKRIQEIIC